MNKTEQLTEEQVKEFYQFLQGELPEGYNIEEPIKLTQEQSFSIIWFLQERYGIIPDNYEQCHNCKEIYDLDSEGFYSEIVGCVCDSCRDEFEKCELCGEQFKKSDKPENEHFVLNFEDAKDQGLKPGLYTAVSFPYWSDDMFSQTLYHWAIKLNCETIKYKNTGKVCSGCFSKEISGDKTHE